MPVKWYQGTVTRIEEASPTTKRFWLKLEDNEAFEFKAGQFVTMDLPIGEKRQQRWRSYSIANAPDGSGMLEFCIVHLEGGLATQYFFSEVKIGTPIKFKGPDGNFVLPETLDQDLVLICTGTGLAPFRSMLLTLAKRQQQHRSIHLIFGTRTADGILYRQEMEELSRKLPGFRYSVALSRETHEGFHHGYVHGIYLEEYQYKRPDIAFYLCGWTKMVDEAVANLIVKLGYDRSQIKYELYG